MAAKRPTRGAAPEAEAIDAAAQATPDVQTSDSGLVKWLIVGTTISLLVANFLLWVTELGKY